MFHIVYPIGIFLSYFFSEFSIFIIPVLLLHQIKILVKQDYSVFIKSHLFFF